MQVCRFALAWALQRRGGWKLLVFVAELSFNFFLREKKALLGVFTASENGSGALDF